MKVGNGAIWLTQHNLQRLVMKIKGIITWEISPLGSPEVGAVSCMLWRVRGRQYVKDGTRSYSSKTMDVSTTGGVKNCCGGWCCHISIFHKLCRSNCESQINNFWCQENKKKDSTLQCRSWISCYVIMCDCINS